MVESIDWNDGADDAPQRPRSGLWGRLWRTITGRRDLVSAAALRGVYRERAHLVALLAAWHTSHIGYTDPTTPEWAVVTIELPTGQASWHIAPDDMDLFQHVQQVTRYARSWDGHTTDEKYRRVDAFAAQLAERPF